MRRARSDGLPVAGGQRSLRIVADGIAIADRRRIIRRLPDAAADPEQGRIRGRDRAVRTERDRIRQSHTGQRDVHIRAERRRARAVRQDIVADRRRFFLRRFAVRPKDAGIVAGRQEIVDRVTRAVADRRRSDAAGHRVRADRRGVLVSCLRFVADRRRFARIIRISLHTGESLRADRRGIRGVRRRGNPDRRRIHGIVTGAVFRVRAAAYHFRADRHIVRGRIGFRPIRFVRAECILDPDRDLVIALRRIFVAEGNAVIARRHGFVADRHAGIAIRFGLETHRHGFVSIRFTLIADGQGIMRIVNCTVCARIRAAGCRAVADRDIVRGHLAFRRLGRIRLRLVVETDLNLALRIRHVAAAVGDGVFAIGGIAVAHRDRALAVRFIRGADRRRIVCRRFIGITDRRRIHRIVRRGAGCTRDIIRPARYIRAADGQIVQRDIFAAGLRFRISVQRTAEGIAVPDADLVIRAVIVAVPAHRGILTGHIVAVAHRDAVGRERRRRIRRADGRRIIRARRIAVADGQRVMRIVRRAAGCIRRARIVLRADRDIISGDIPFRRVSARVRLVRIADENLVCRARLRHVARAVDRAVLRVRRVVVADRDGVIRADSRRIRRPDRRTHIRLRRIARPDGERVMRIVRLAVLRVRAARFICAAEGHIIILATALLRESGGIRLEFIALADADLVRRVVRLHVVAEEHAVRTGGRIAVAGRDRVIRADIHDVRIAHRQTVIGQGLVVVPDGRRLLRRVRITAFRVIRTGFIQSADRDIVRLVRAALRRRRRRRHDVLVPDDNLVGARRRIAVAEARGIRARDGIRIPGRDRIIARRFIQRPDSDRI